MARTKGAKNKPKDIQFHLQELERLGYKIQAETGNETEETVINKTIKETLNIETETKEKDNLVCGNCQNFLESEYDFCPFCNVGLIWS